LLIAYFAAAFSPLTPGESIVHRHLDQIDWGSVDAAVDPAAFSAYLDRLDASPRWSDRRGAPYRHPRLIAVP